VTTSQAKCSTLTSTCARMDWSLGWPREMIEKLSAVLDSVEASGTVRGLRDGAGGLAATTTHGRACLPRMLCIDHTTAQSTTTSDRSCAPSS